MRKVVIGGNRPKPCYGFEWLKSNAKFELFSVRPRYKMRA